MKDLKFLFIGMLFSCLFLTACGNDDETPDPPPVDTAEEIAIQAFADYFEDSGNSVVDPGFAAGTITPSADLGATSSAPSGLMSTSYKGAIDPSGAAWYTGWTAYESILGGGATTAFTPGANAVSIDDAVMAAAGNNVMWTKDNTYVLDGFVFVNDGQTLNIEAGTVIQGKSGEGSEASALIIARGGTIDAQGTATEPIIFTFEGDTGNTNPSTRGQWGGLIILGKASLNSNPGETAVEGIPTTELRGLYGGTDDTDSSGKLTYVSIRHGGTNIGADNEINGLTLGGVGSGTTIDYVEVVSNKDDGIEWFGGTVNGAHLLSVFCGDDGLDYDEGYRGNNQFVIVHQDPAAGDADRGGEHDGGTDPEIGTPYATPKFFNVTSIGNSGSRALTFRDNACGEYHNSIFSGYARGVDIEFLKSQEQHSYKQFDGSILKLENNVFNGIGTGDTGADVFTVTVVE